MIERLLTPLISQRFLEDERYRNGHLRVINALNDVRILGGAYTGIEEARQGAFQKR